MTRLINTEALSLLELFEGLKLQAYLCPTGHVTIGYGHTGPDVVLGMTITQAQAYDLLNKDLTKFEEAVMSLVTVDLTDNQYGALVVFAFNVGEGAFKKSSLLRVLNQGNYEAAADGLLAWDHGLIDGHYVKLPGLTARREAEKALFLTLPQMHL